MSISKTPAHDEELRKECEKVASSIFFVRENVEGSSFSVVMRSGQHEMEIHGPHYGYDHAEHWMRLAEKIAVPALLRLCRQQQARGVRRARREADRRSDTFDAAIEGCDGDDWTRFNALSAHFKEYGNWCEATAKELEQ